MKKRVVIILCAAILITLLSVKIYDRYFVFKPIISIKHITYSYFNDYTVDLMLIMIGSYDEDSYISKKFAKNYEAFSDWFHEIDFELNPYIGDYIAPTEVKLYAEVEKGLVTFRFEGYVTTSGGITKDYLKEETFDLMIVPELKGFNDSHNKLKS